MTPLDTLRSRRAPRPIAGRVVAITGGARGLGLATARALAARGACIAIGDLDGDLARTEAAALPGPKHFGAALDVTDADGFSRFLDEAEAALGPLDVLVNNAGIMVVSPFIDEDPALTRREFEINVLAVITGTQLALRRMLPRRSGHIVNIASAAGKAGVAGEATYCATKHAVVGLDETLRSEYRKSGVTFTTVMPGLANTELAAGMKPGRGVPLVEPDEVAEGIIGALETGRVEVYVPPRIGPIVRSQALMPRALRDALARAFQTDKIGTDVDRQARAAYAERAARAPAVEEEPASEAADDVQSASEDPDTGAKAAAEQVV
jgi:NAD(P)-dependent dehydrogenase (short-subunit alcohol dehydrogenase family)